MSKMNPFQLPKATAGVLIEFSEQRPPVVGTFDKLFGHFERFILKRRVDKTHRSPLNNQP
jgi:hypothetical protein